MLESLADKPAISQELDFCMLWPPNTSKCCSGPLPMIALMPGVAEENCMTFDN